MGKALIVPASPPAPDDPSLNSQPSTLNSSPMIAVRGLKKRIGTQEILCGVDVSVAIGETLVIIGRSGGGKSVFLKNLIGLMQPNEGEIWIDGQNIIGLGERQLAIIRRKDGMIENVPLSRRVESWFAGGDIPDAERVHRGRPFAVGAHGHVERARDGQPANHG